MNNGINPNFLALFTENDRIEESETDDEWEENKQIIYKSTIKIIKRRLDIMWFNLKTLEHYFNKRKDQDEDNSELLQDFTFDEYLSKLKIIYENNVFFFWWSWDFTWQDEYITYILWDMETLNPRVDIDSRYYLRGFLEMIDENIEIKVDLSDLIQWGYCDIGEKFAENGLTINNKVTIYVEWTTDIQFIRDSMSLLFPEYINYYNFINKDTSGLELNCSRLITYCKSHISTQTKDKIVFIFDNDIPWKESQQKLWKEIQQIPNNICITSYPDIEFAKNYPTTWVQSHMDINWIWCSIELYCCEEALKDDQDNLIPIQISLTDWKINQGSFSSWEKSTIQNKFREILKECKVDRSKANDYNFDNMKILLESIFTSFDYKEFI